MVTNQASLKRNGVQDYVTLRATAFIITLFSFYMCWFFASTPSITYEVWRGLFSAVWMKVFTAATLISILMHVRIGLWQVLTDYVKPTGVRTVLQYLLNLIAFGYAAVGLFILLEV